MKPRAPAGHRWLATVLASLGWLSVLHATDLFESLPPRLAERIQRNRSQDQKSRGHAWVAALPPSIKAVTDFPYATVPGVEQRLNTLDVFHSVVADARRPIVIFIHGGGMSAGDKSPGVLVANKAAHFPAHGFVFVSANYRLAPEARHPAATQDVIAAIAFVRSHAGEWGGDPNAIFVIGHSAGAQLAVQAVTDAKALHDAGVPPASLRGAVLIDTALYDIPYALAQPDDDGLQREIVEMTYGSSPTAWTAASPINRVDGAPTWPPLLVFHAEDPASLSYRAARRFAEKVRAAGGAIELQGAREKDHSHLGRDVGNQGDWITDLVMNFLQSRTR